MKDDKTIQAVSLFDKYAQTYQDKYMDVSMYAESLDILCDHLNSKKAHILELASGPGNISKYLLTQLPKLKILATDLSPEMLKLASLNNPSIETRMMDCRKIIGLQKKYDAIICGFGLPYLSKEDALQLIEDAQKCLTPNGLLYLSTMEGSYSDSKQTTSSQDPNDSLFTHYHEEGYLVEHMIKNEFHLIQTTKVKYQDDKENLVTDLIIIGKLNDY